MPSRRDLMLTAFFHAAMRRSPEDATALGVDHNKFAVLKSGLAGVSLAAIDRNKADTARRIQLLRGMDRAALSGLPAVNYDSVLYTLAVEDDANRLFNYGRGGADTPYVLSQLAGAYQSVPDRQDTVADAGFSADAGRKITLVMSLARRAAAREPDAGLCCACRGVVEGVPRCRPELRGVAA